MISLGLYNVMVQGILSYKLVHMFVDDHIQKYIKMNTCALGIHGLLTSPFPLI